MVILHDSWSLSDFHPAQLLHRLRPKHPHPPPTLPHTNPTNIPYAPVASATFKKSSAVIGRSIFENKKADGWGLVVVTRETAIRKASEAAFGKPLVTNVLRSLIVEAILAEALPPQWAWCAADYAPCDFIHANGARLEVKQSAARQSWHAAGAEPSKASFDIAERTGRYEGSVWIPEPGRNADIYTLAHHPICDDSADHRDPSQWRFYNIATKSLPDARSISLAGVQRLSHGLALDAAIESIETLRQALDSTK